MAGEFKFGRMPRTADPRIPHFSALKYTYGTAPVVLPQKLNYASGMNQDFGMMLNDKIGDCTCAAFYHARQVWSFNSTHHEITESDDNVMLLYRTVSGYDPAAPLDENGKNPTDKGVNEQNLLRYLHSSGAPIGNGGHTTDKIVSFVEVDPRNANDMKRSIHDCGIAYVGFNVPNSLEQSPLPHVWDAIQGDQLTGEGHAVILTGWDDIGYDLISWGRAFRMTYAFVNAYVDEAYAVNDISWTKSTGKSLLSMSLEEMKSTMTAF